MDPLFTRSRQGLAYRSSHSDVEPPSAGAIGLSTAELGSQRVLIREILSSGSQSAEVGCGIATAADVFDPAAATGLR
jgi:hypothetical protein